MEAAGGGAAAAAELGNQLEAEATEGAMEAASWRQRQQQQEAAALGTREALGLGGDQSGGGRPALPLA